jgi:hypothetical protein
MAKCIQCGGEAVQQGALYAPTRVSFRPDGTKFLTFETGDVLTKALMCRDCGLVQIIGDANKLRRLTGSTEREPGSVG